MPMRLRLALVLALGLACSACLSRDTGTGSSSRTDLTVAVFAYLPDAAALVEAFEDAFEAKRPSIDLDLKLWDPYDLNTLKAMKDYDIVEIDFARFHDILADRDGSLGGLDRIPDGLRPTASDLIEPASTALADREVQSYFIPHWVCGNFFVSWADNQALKNARTFDEILAALDPKDAGLLADLDGKTTLGEHYADAAIDIKGVDFARAHFASFAKDPNTKLVPEATAALKKLLAKVDAQHCEYLSHFHDYYNGAYPEEFARSPRSALIGYSERLYYMHMHYLRSPWDRPSGKPVQLIDPAWLVVRPFWYADSSKGTPSWVDGFVIPKGKLSANRDAIESFLEFVNTEDGLRPFLFLVSRRPATYLLPASAAAYRSEIVRKNCPALLLFRDALKGAVLLSGERVYDGIRNAGAALAKEL